MENEKLSELKQKQIRHEYFCNTETLWEAILAKESRFLNFLLYPVFHLSYKLRNKLEEINILRNLWKKFLSVAASSFTSVHFYQEKLDSNEIHLSNTWGNTSSSFLLNPWECKRGKNEHWIPLLFYDQI